jgi:hypothetical protein
MHQLVRVSPTEANNLGLQISSTQIMRMMSCFTVEGKNIFYNCYVYLQSPSPNGLVIYLAHLPCWRMLLILFGEK